MKHLLYTLAGVLWCAVFPSGAADKYSIIPEPERTELKPQTTRTLKLLSDKAEASLG
ncbi:MAG: beta-N-acetylhexosaminidase, partial [Akkermansia sp.]|nr:beta-N-acetylhexosaminidase [Akkermansia sp.]